MKKKYAFILTGIIMITVVLKLFASSSGIAGETGSPGETTCVSCHSSFGLNTGPGSVSITHNIPGTGYVPSTTYQINVIVSHTGRSLFGFDFEALNSTNTSTGTIAVTDPGSTQLMTAPNGRANITHQFNGGASSNSKTFTFNWTAPATNVGNITFYAAGNAADNSGTNINDYIYTTSSVVIPLSIPTITTGTITGTAFCAGQTGINVPYTKTGTFNSGNIFTAQLSDASGSFTSPTTLGTLNSVNAGTIVTTVGLPSTAGTGYRIRVIGSNPATTGTQNASNLSIALPPTQSNAGLDQPVCGTNATMAGNTPASGSGIWTRISGFGTITTPSSPSTTITGLGPGENKFVWNIIVSGCNASRDTVSLTGTSVPTTSSAGGDIFTCVANVTLTGNTPTSGTGTWSRVSGAGTIGNNTSASTSVTGLGTGDNTFVWTISNPPCAASRDTVIVTYPGAVSTADAGQDQDLCASFTTLTAITPINGTGAWSVASGSGTFGNTAQNNSGVSVLAVGDNFLVWTVSAGACNSRDTVKIMRKEPPTIATAGPDQTACANSAVLAGNTPVIGTGAWAVVSGSATITNPGNPASGVTGLGVGSNILKWTISNSPCAASIDSVVINHSGTITNPNAGTDQNICSTTATLAANTPSVGTGQWTQIAGTGTITDPTDPSTTVTNLGIGTNVFRWTISVASCSPAQDEVTVANCANHTITTGTINGSPFCSNTSYNVSVPYTKNGTYTDPFIVELSDSTGDFSNADSIGAGTSSPIAAVIPSNTLEGSGYRIRVRNTNPAITGSANTSNLQINTCKAIMLDSVEAGPFCAITKYTLTINYTSVGLSGTFTAQLSDATGSFASPVNIGTSTGNSINATIPSASTKGTAYRIRISNGGVNSNASLNPVEINTCPGVGIEEMLPKTFSLFPNPNNGEFNIVLNGSKTALVNIFNILGELQLTQTISGVDTIKLNNPESGIYLVQVKTESGVEMIRISISN